MSSPPRARAKLVTIVRRSRSPKPFPFLSLPAELRNQIYSLCILGRPHDGSSSGGTPPTNLICVVGSRFCLGDHQPIVTRINRQMRHEALSLFYRENVFTFNFDCDRDTRWPYPHDFFSHWLGIIGPSNTRNLRCVKIASPVLHVRNLTITFGDSFPSGKLALEMAGDFFENTWIRPEQRQRSLWLLETFLINGFEAGEGELVARVEDVTEMVDLLWRFQKKIEGCSHPVPGLGKGTDYCEKCGVWRFRRTRGTLD